MQQLSCGRCFNFCLTCSSERNLMSNVLSLVIFRRVSGGFQAAKVMIPSTNTFEI